MQERKSRKDSEGIVSERFFSLTCDEIMHE